MFVITTVADTICIPPAVFYKPTLTSVHTQIDQKYPNRVIMNVGLVICRYGDVLQIGDGVCVPGDGSAHHEVVFRLVVFRPFVDEVCVGVIDSCDETGINVRLGDFFYDIFIPAYWMLNPSKFDEESALWVWTPDYADDDNEEDGDNGGGEGEGAEQQKFEMQIGSEIRFKVKGHNFWRVTNTAKGMQATNTSTGSKLPRSAKGSGTKGEGGGGMNDGDADDAIDVDKFRTRSSSVDLSEAENIPASMQITASICEDGLGLVSWWTNEDDEEEEEEEEEEGDEGEEGDYYEEGEEEVIKEE